MKAVKVLLNRLGFGPGESLLILRRGPGHGEGEWDFPGGKMESDDLCAEARREVFEETGMSIRLLSAIASYTEHSDRYGDIEFTIMWACTDDDSVRLSNEHTAYQWVSIDKLIELVPGPASLAVIDWWYYK